MMWAPLATVGQVVSGGPHGKHRTRACLERLPVRQVAQPPIESGRVGNGALPHDEDRRARRTIAASLCSFGGCFGVALRWCVEAFGAIRH